LLSNADPKSANVNPRDVVPEGLVDEWVNYPIANGSSKLTHSLKLLMKLRRYSFETLVYLAPRLRSKEDVRRDLLFFRLAGISNVIGAKEFAPLPRNKNERLPRVTNEVDHLLERVAQDGITVPAAGKAQVELLLTDTERFRAIAWLKSKVEDPDARPLVAFGPGSKWPSKVWPEDRFLEVGRMLIEQFDAHPIVFGGPDDRALGERLIRAWGRGANAAGELSVREAGATLGHCRMYVGNDTGTMHLAAAAGARCVVVMSALDWPGHWDPYGEGHTVLRKCVPCEGCLLKICEHEAMRCMKEISVSEVLEACSKTLSMKVLIDSVA
jgi:ADP-heptose:LPS heptosyltransferase